MAKDGPVFLLLAAMWLHYRAAAIESVHYDCAHVLAWAQNLLNKRSTHQPLSANRRMAVLMMMKPAERTTRHDITVDRSHERRHGIHGSTY